MFPFVMLAHFSMSDSSVSRFWMASRSMTSGTMPWMLLPLRMHLANLGAADVE